MTKRHASPLRAFPVWRLATLLLVAALTGALVFYLAPPRPLADRDNASAPYMPRPVGTVTYSRDIAPIIYKNCASCHRPGQSAPFDLLTFEDVRKRARQIVEVTSSRYMPPWLPDPRYARFLFERRLTPTELGLMRQWAEDGAPPGELSDLPPLPDFVVGWHLGQPDLIARMPEPYLLPAEGRDVYRNFVIPAPVDQPRYVSAVELKPGDSRALHHAFVLIDDTGQSRRLDEQDQEVGIPGMSTPPTALIPEGQFLCWQPGKIPLPVPPGLAWRLEPGTDLILQIHMQPTGKPETIQPAIGLFFTDQTPTNAPFKIGLRSFEIDIPAGVSNHVVEHSYELPVDVEILSVLPHAHYLGRDLQGFAVLPDGARRWLLRIPDWDFNWQGDYQYSEPMRLPAGSRLVMRFVYDNSPANVRNPHDPPQRVRYGVDTTDEMGELWFQVLTRNRQDRDLLERHYRPLEIQEIMTFNQYRLRQDPRDAQAHCQLAKARLALGQPEQAYPHLLAAIQARPDYDEAHYYLGILHRSQNQPDQARAAFEKTVQCNPAHYKAHGNLGLMALQTGELNRAESHFQAALQANPQDALAMDGLGLVYQGQKKWAEAERQFQAALQVDPGFANARLHLEQLQNLKRP